MKIYLGADHGGFELKQQIIKHLKKQKIAFTDCGAYKADPDDNFPDFARAVAKNVIKTNNARGILICGSGVGVSIAANRYRGIRAALVHTAELAGLARKHNDANVLCMGGRFVSVPDAIAITTAFLSTAADPNPKYKARMDTADKGGN